MFSADTINTNFPTFAPKPAAYQNVKQFSKEPINTGTSVLGVVFQGGVVLAADTLTSYGSMARFNDIPRVIKVNENTILGAGGDYADFQHMQDLIQQRVIEDECIDDGFAIKPKALFNWLTGHMYHRRSKFDPLWNSFLIAGIDDDQPFLGFVDKLGTAFSDTMICTGFGSYLAMPLIRKAVEDAKPRGGLTQQEAVALIEKCLEILYYRDARSWPHYHLGIVTKDNVNITGPHATKSNWDVADFVAGYE